ncbi:MAG: hypothetical protein ABI778_10425 [Ignavibacteriota bacterium]
MSQQVKKKPFLDWLNKLDVITRNIIRRRLNRIRLGNFGDANHSVPVSMKHVSMLDRDTAFTTVWMATGSSCY